MTLRPLFLVVAALSVLNFSGTAAAADDGTACLTAKPRPPLHLPWKNAAELCAADFGTPVDLAPPPDLDNLATQNAYSEKVQGFLRAFEYRDLGWLHDPRWRLTGEWAGCPQDGKDSWSNETHPLVKIYYSPEVMTWLCKYRREDVPPPGEEEPMPSGAMIIKEMHSAVVGSDQAPVLAYRPDTATEDAFGKLWVDADFAGDGISWTIMIKGASTPDGWMWGDLGQASSPGAVTYNPPLEDVSAFAVKVDPKTGFPFVKDADGKLYPPPPHGPWYPTYWNFSVPDVVYPAFIAGSYCMYCHGSAVSESTFSSLDNLLGKEIEFDYLRQIPPSPSPTPTVDDHERVLSEPLKLMRSTVAASNPRDPFPAYAPLNVESFGHTFPQFAGLTFDDVWPDRLPAQTWDHAPASADGHEFFLTSDQCMGCHGAGGASQRLPNMVVVKDDPDREQIDVTPWAEWSASPMGLAGRDPIFYTMLESELNRAEREKGLADQLACIQNTCLHCHGNMGQRQFALDTRDQGEDPCASFEPITDPTSGGTWTEEERRKAGYGGQPFLRSTMKTWPGDDWQLGKYGGLGRDGISCTTCHRMSAEDLGESGKTFTGNFRTGPEDELFGPFEDDVKTEPMKLALDITPVFGEHMKKSSLCGSCHAIYLPVFDNQGELLGASFEQTTYLEWLNSAFNEENKTFPPRESRSCQECHMRDSLVYRDDHGDLVEVDLSKERIANIEDPTFPDADFRQADLDLEYRDYKRHTFYGLNVFLNAYFQQFPLLLGARQQNYMDGAPTAPLLTAREEALLIARLATAKVKVDNVAIDEDAQELRADVTITNLAGHKLPSGVGFRRAFIEFQVLDGEGQALWASGLTSQVGLLQNGLSGEDLPSELLRADPSSACPEPYQPHYQVITEPCQVQIYEELTQDSDHHFTTSFIHRVFHIKDNRLLPRGYRVIAKDDPNQPAYCAPWCAEANPDGRAVDDPDYQASGPYGVSGRDTVTYRVTLPADQLSRVATVQATLYSQSTAPYFLNQRFDDAKAGPRDDDTKRLYFLTSHLNTQARAEDGTAYLDQYKLRIDQASVPCRDGVCKD